MRKLISVLFLTLFVSHPALALNIMLTNDDGYQHPWLRTLQSVLAEAGHDVTIVAPQANQSGQSAALTLDALRNSADAITNPAEGVYAVKGSPATAAILGATKVLPQRPDLIISGINEGANIGVFSSFSGTVGATVAALHMAGAPIPAIAISSNLLDAKAEASAPANLQHAKQIAEFMVTLVAALQQSQTDNAPLLPRGIALNVNYPALPQAQIRGAGIYRHGHDIKVYYNQKTPLPAALTTGELEQDTFGLRQGFITIVPIDGDYTAPDWQGLLPASLVPSLNKQP
nr:5'/3'-nucleotidase SurE [Aestuariicella hydrocarbonica]